VYVIPCFITSLWSNARKSSVKPCGWCMVYPTIGWIGNQTLVIIWEGLLPICISTIVHWFGVQFWQFMLRAFHVCECSIIILISMCGLWKFIHMFYLISQRVLCGLFQTMWTILWHVLANGKTLANFKSFITFYILKNSLSGLSCWQGM
jgi:hypothetical protein